MKSLLRPAALVAALVALAAAPAAAQDQPSEFESWRVPGWTFTPGVIFGTLFDTNVAVAFPPSGSQRTASDTLFQVEPYGQLEYLSPRTNFFSGYRGFLRRYMTLHDLDGIDQRGYMSLRE